MVAITILNVSIVIRDPIDMQPLLPVSDCKKKTKLEALGKRRPPWPRQIITPILSTIKLLSLAGERLTPKVLDHYLHHDLVMLPLLWCYFAHLLILEYLDHHQNLISSLLYYPGPLHKISYKSIYNFLPPLQRRLCFWFISIHS